MKNGKLYWGLLFIGIGLLFFLNIVLNFEIFTIEKIWPIFILIPGLCLESAYFLARRNPQILIPGGILITIGGLFFFETYSNWEYIRLTWPVFILAVAVGLLQFYFFAGKPKEILIPVSILSAVGLVALVVLNLNALKEMVIFSSGVALIFIIIGIWLLLKK